MLTNAPVTSPLNVGVDQSVISTVLADYPDLANEVMRAMGRPSVSPDFNPTRLETYFDDVLVSVRGHGSFSIKLPVTYRPTVIAVYGDDELLLVKANGQLILNRLSNAYIKPEWSNYGTH